MSKALKEKRSFAETLVAWQKAHGRHHLPWQNTQDPYRVWLSEIMLQQTQVSTVLGYYEKFLQHFPTVADLAAASQDKVMGLWSGLGYYSRARNLHQCAKDVLTRFDGKFPSTAAELITLPGIGRSTAAAVASFCFSERVAIMDGNVKRDLGATICLPRKPNCQACPVKNECKALAQAEPEKFPVKTRKIKRTSEVLWLLLAQNSKGEVWLEKRPSSGIWASLYSLPVFESEASLRTVFETNSKTSPMRSIKSQATGQLEVSVLSAFKHVLTHKDLHCHVVKVRLKQKPKTPQTGAWWSENNWQALGLPTPIRHLLSNSL